MESKRSDLPEKALVQQFDEKTIKKCLSDYNTLDFKAVMAEAKNHSDPKVAKALLLACLTELQKRGRSSLILQAASEIQFASDRYKVKFEFTHFCALPPDLRELLYQQIDHIVGFEIFEMPAYAGYADHKTILIDRATPEEAHAFDQLKERCRKIAARNCMLNHYRKRYGLELEGKDDLWLIAVDAFLDVEDTERFTQTEGYYFGGSIYGRNLSSSLIELGPEFFNRVWERIIEREQLARNKFKPSMTTFHISAPNEGNPEYTELKWALYDVETRNNTYGCSWHQDILNIAEKRLSEFFDAKVYLNIFKQHISRCPFEKVTFKLSGTQETIFQSIEELIPHLTNLTLREIEFSFYVPETIDQQALQKKINSWVNLAKTNNVTTFIHFKFYDTKAPQENKWKTLPSVELDNEIAKNRRLWNKAVRQNKLEHKDHSTVSAEEKTESKEKYSTILARQLNPLFAKQHLQMHMQHQQQQQVTQQIVQSMGRQQAKQQRIIQGAITEKNLVNRAAFSEFFSSYIRFRGDHFKAKDRVKYLNNESLWDSMLGHLRLPGNIKYLTPAAAFQILSCPEIFIYGVNLNNLLQYFYISVTENGDHVLCYDPLKLIERPTSPLTLKAISYRRQADLHGDLRQFDIDEQKYPDALTEETIKDQKRTLELLQKIMLGEDQKLAQEIQSQHEPMIKLILNQLVGIKGLLSLLYEEGCFSFKIILEKLQAIKNKYGDRACKNFINCFLATSENWIELVETNQLASMDRLLTLTPEQFNWWETLTAQHVQAAKSANIEDLLNGFLYFCEEYQAITKQSLPAVCPLKGVRNMKIALDGLLDILKNSEQSNHLQEQCAELDLDLGPEGAHDALHEGYHIVTPEMQLQGMVPNTLAQYADVTDFTYAVDRIRYGYDYVSKDRLTRELFLRKHQKEEKLYSQAVSDFYREYGTRYKDTFASSSTSGLTWERIQVDFILILEHTTTHDRAKAHHTEFYIKQHTTDLVKLLNEIKEDSQTVSYSGDKIPNVERIADNLAKWNNSSPRITLQEAVGIARLLSEYHNNEINNVNFQIRALVYLYKEQFLKKLIAWHENDKRLSASDFLKQFNPYRVDASLLMELANDRDINFQQMKVYFYRYLGRQRYFPFYKSYKDVLQNYIERSNLDETAQKKLLVVIALTTMQLRGYQITLDHAVKSFLSSLPQDPHAITQQLDYLIQWNEVTPRINLSEAGSILNILQECKSDVSSSINQQLRKLAASGKEIFLKALVTRQKNPHRILADDFLRIHDVEILGESKSEEGADEIVLRHKAALIFSIVKWDSTASSHVDDLFAAIRKFKKSHGDECLHNLLDMLGMIDVAASRESLPTLETLITVMNACEQFSKIKSYPDLYSFLSQNQLPNCVFDTSYNAYRIDKLGAQLLQEIKDKFPEWKEEDQQRLFNIIKTRFPEALSTPASLNAIFAKLAHITKQWPGKISPLLKGLYDLEKSQLGKGILDIDFLGEVFTLLCNQGDKTNSFPLKILNAIVSHPDIANVKQKEYIYKSLLTIFENNSINYNQKINLLMSAITVSNKNDPHNFVLAMMQQAKRYPSCFNDMLIIYNQEPASLEETHHIMRGLTSLFTQLDKNIFQQVPQNIFSLIKSNRAVYLPLVSKIVHLPEEDKRESKEEDTQSKRQVAILTIVAHCCTTKLSTSQVETLAENLHKLNSNLLQELVILCINKPTPTFDVLFDKVSHADSLREWLLTFATHPHGQRHHHVIKEQFDSQGIPEAIANLVDFNCNDVRPLTTMQRLKLQQWFHLVNDLGHNANRAIYERNNNGKKIKLAAKDLSQKEIRVLVQRYRKILSDPEQSPEAKLTARLASVAIAREAMYRATGLFPNSTQILALLNKIMQGSFVESEMKVGFGKTMMTGLEAFMLWVEEEGSTVDVTTQKAVDSERDLKFNKPFFQLTGVPVGGECINAQSTSESYCLDGVNYGSMGNLAIYRERMQIEGTYQEPNKLSLVVTEPDAMTLDEKIHYRYAANMDMQDGSNQNKFAWIYPFLSRYVKSGAYKLQDVTDYILSKVNESMKENVAKIIAQLDPKRIDTWVRAAIAASGLHEHKEFVIKPFNVATDDDEETIQMHAACILMEDGYPNYDARWSYGAHQIVEAGLAEEKKLPFRSEPEISAVATMSAKGFIEFYRTRGCIWLNGGTVGSHLERHEQQQKYQFKMFGIPNHHKNQRVDRLPIIATTQDTQQESITQQVISHLRQQHRYWFSRDSKPQPTTIIGKDIQQTENIYLHLKTQLAARRGLQYRLYVYNGARAVMHTANGDEVVVPPRGKTLDEYMVSQAGLPGSIVVTNLFARDTNINARLSDDDNALPHPDGLFVINTFLAAERATQQIVGRTARQGRPGEYIFIGQESDLAGTEINADIPTRIRQAQERNTESLTKGRQLRDRQSDIKSCVFDKLFQLLSALPLDAKEARREILATWAKSLELIENQWLQIEADTLRDLKASTPEQIEECCEMLTTSMCNVWDGFLAQVQGTLAKHALEVKEAKVQKEEKQSEILGALKLDRAIVQNEIATRQYARPKMMSKYANYAAMPFKQTDPQKTYERFNPLALLSDVKVPKQSIKQITLDFLRAYQNTWFKGKDRIENVNHLIEQVEVLDESKVSFVTNLLWFINEASNNAMRSDWQVDKNSFFFKRNSNGSRYQTTLDEIEKNVIAYAAEKDAKTLIDYQLTAIDNRLKRIKERNNIINNADVSTLLENNTMLKAGEKISYTEINNRLIEFFKFNPQDIHDRSLRDLVISLREKCYELQPLIGQSLPPQARKPLRIGVAGIFTPKTQAPETNSIVMPDAQGLGLIIN